MALYEIEKNSSGVPTGNYKYVAGRVDSEKINEMYEAFPSDASASNKLVTESDIPVMESGEAQVTGGIATVSFTGTHSSPPKAVVVSALEDTGSTRIAWVRTKTSSDFAVAVTNASETAATCKLEWIAIW